MQALELPRLAKGTSWDETTLNSAKSNPVAVFIET